MNYKKLNEVDVIESMSDSGFILGVDDNGGIKRVPKSTMGKIKTINGAEPDENGNIEVVGGNENLVGVGVTEFVQSVFQLPDGMTGTINLRAGIEGGTHWGSWMAFDEYLLVNFDGTDYTCKVSRDGPPPDSWATAWAGNYSLCDSTKEDTGEPFFVYLDGDMQSTIWWVADNSVEHTAICRTGNFVTGLVPEEYLPWQPTALTIPYVVTGQSYQTKVGGYYLSQIKELLAKGCSVSFLQTPENAGDEYTAPLLYTLSGGIAYDGDYEGEGLIFAAMRITVDREDNGVSEDLSTYYPPAIVGFHWSEKGVIPFTKTLTLS